ncbi:MAG: hypothetical protein GX436_09490 [Synergistaceae bacterium]|nr:hypothetical protein [Synergistaceae bacterium]
MRKKTFIYWGAIFLTIVLVGAGAAVLGRGRGPRMASCLPKPPGGVPYVLVEKTLDPVGPGKSEGPFGLVRSIPDEAAWKDLMQMGANVPSSFLLTFGESRQRHWGVFAPGRETVQSFLTGRLPADWAEFFVGSPSEEGRKPGNGTWRLMHTQGAELFLRVDGNLLLVADRPEELDRMQSSRNRRLESVASAWRVQPGWAGHLRMSDAGRPELLPFDFPERQGEASSGGRPFTVEAAWRGVPPFGGEGAWVWEGAEGRWPWGNGVLPVPIRWDMKLTFPEPLALAFGCAGFDPSRQKEVLSEDIGDSREKGRFWRAWMGLPEDKVRRFLKGPVVVSVGGTGRAMGFSTPGFLIEFPGRKEEGLDFVRSLLGERWGLSGLLGRDVGGFEVGGAVPLPFTVMAAANRETAVIGYLEPPSLGTARALQDLSPDFQTPAVFWAWLDGEALSRALESFTPGSPGSLLMGMAGNGEKLERLQELAKQIGRLSAVMPAADSGQLRWSGVEPHERRP